ncbi:MAG TPA: MBL fold metallo-hydrolase [Candidatus Acidoferrales bacterium]|jgi:glyoxylase-like metal-dependent hydrolase (beta-lactamase superfamily II)|nr:MBL fold metallo-hydrolase [Candidatus Acidoferrales bacterium]
MMHLHPCHALRAAVFVVLAASAASFAGQASHLLATPLAAPLADPQAPVKPASPPSFDIVKVGDGVYAAIGQNGVFGNGAFIVSEVGVLVVDTQARPSWARDLIAEIRKVTDKPVRYVVNTHWHGDHVQGNQAYLAEFGGGVEFISQTYTREDIIARGGPQLQQQVGTTIPAAIAQLQKQLADGKDAQGVALTDATRAQLQAQLKLQQDNLAEYKNVTLVPSTITYDTNMILHLAGREIDLLHWGLAHTRGDTVVYLPKEHIVITGDLLTNGIPVMRTAYPVEWVASLQAIDKLDWTAAIPGHGNVQQGKTQLESLLAYMTDLVAGVKASVAKGQTMEQAETSVDLSKYKSAFPNFDTGGNKSAIDRAWTEISGKPMQ